MNFARRHWIFQFLLRMQLRNDGRMFHAEIDRLHLNRRTFCLQQSPPFFRSSNENEEIRPVNQTNRPEKKEKNRTNSTGFPFYTIV